MRQDGIAVDGDVEFAEGLSGGGAELRDDLVLGQLIHSFDLDPVDEGLGTLLDFESDGEIPYRKLVNAVSRVARMKETE